MKKIILAFVLSIAPCLLFAQFKAGLSLDMLFPKSQDIPGTAAVKCDIGYKTGILAAYQFCSFAALSTGINIGQVERNVDVILINDNLTSHKYTINTKYKTVGIPLYFEISDYRQSLSPIIDLGVEKQFVKQAGYNTEQTYFLGAVGIRKTTETVDLKFSVKYLGDFKGENSNLGINSFGVGFSFMYNFNRK